MIYDFDMLKWINEVAQNIELWLDSNEEGAQVDR